MIHITLGPEVLDPKDDELDRSRTGFSADMTQAELYEASRGCWVLGNRADRERFALVSYGGVVRLAIEIERLERQSATGRRAIEGRILEPGHPVHDAFVGGEAPVGRVRNPITYLDTALDRRPCACGCERRVLAGDFLPGHDQRAIHERISRLGSVIDFLRWFDATFEAGSAPGASGQPDPRAIATR